jgi:methylglutaconyl-CoA hydratase
MVTAILRRNVSEKRAFELLTRGSEIDARTAQEFGLINQVFAEENFDGEVRAYAAQFEKLSRSAVGLTKSLLYQIDGLAFPEALAAGADTNVIARLTDNCRAGIESFLSRKTDAS